MPPIDSMKQLMAQATQLVRSGKLAEATRVLQQALGRSSPPGPPAPAPVARHSPAPAAPRAFTHAEVEDAVVVERAEPMPRQAGPTTPPTLPAETSAPSAPPAPAAPRPPEPAARHPAAEPPGSFTRVAFTPAPGSADAALHQGHHYHLYVPPGATPGAPLPLVVMLHGCTQDPEDFARGTGMNDAAARAPALVLYPEQPHSANAHGCWNWFRPGDQRRGSGEPALLMAMVRDVMARHAVDERRVYVAGLSAGGAMAAVLAREYPDVFAAAGVHSGLAAGAAHNLMTALSAMKHGAQPHARATPVAAPGQPVVPVIVFHGDADSTVHALNGERVVSAALGAIGGGQGTLVRHVEQGRSPGGQAYTRTVHRSAGSGAAGPVVAEHWVLHGGGHAWAGGSARGSHTDPRGVSATEQMLRFFLQHHRQAPSR